MKRLTMWILAAALTGLLLAPTTADAAKKSKNIKVGDVYRGVSFTSRPRMALVPDTRIYYLRDQADYDLYQTGNFWYLFDNGRWYRARSWEGPFTYVHTNSIPREVRTLPKGYRRSYTPTSSNVRGLYQGTAVNFTTTPRMAIIPDTRVYYVRDESDLDLYQYGNRWYLVENGTWYRAPSWRGPFVAVGTRTVPREVLTVPSGYRRNWTPPTSYYTPSNAVPQIGSRYRGNALQFDTRPSMGTIPDSRVTYLRDHTDLDLYQYGNNWYYLEDGTWYRSSSWQGPFLSMRTTNVPRQVLTVPEEYRRNWSAGTGRVTASEVGNRYRGAAVTFNARPSMSLIPNSRVYYMSNDPDRDLYLYGNQWYHVDTNGTWYRAPSWQGPFRSIRTDTVPRDVLTVPSGYRTWEPPTWVY